MKQIATQQFGHAGESAVADFLQGHGFTILKRNFSFRGGEVDIIAQRNELRVFVEVKTRKGPQFPITDVITFSKQKKIVATAHYFNAQHGWGDQIIHRFDVACVTPVEASLQVTYIKNAFTPSSDWIL